MSVARRLVSEAGGNEATLAISVRQPYAELILRKIKKAEYRSQPTAIRERVWIYAALRPAEDEVAWGKARRFSKVLPIGAVVGSVEIGDCRWDAKRKCFAYVLRNPRRVTPCRVAHNQPLPRFWRPKFASGTVRPKRVRG